MKNLRANIFNNSKDTERVVIVLLLAFISFIALCLWLNHIVTKDMYARILCFVAGALYLVALYSLEKIRLKKYKLWHELAKRCTAEWNRIYESLPREVRTKYERPYEYAEPRICNIIKLSEDSIINRNVYIQLHIHEGNIDSQSIIALLIIYCAIDIESNLYVYELCPLWDELLRMLINDNDIENYSFDSFIKAKSKEEKILFINTAYKAGINAVS